MTSDEVFISNDLKNRQICAALIQDLGHLHNVTQLLINTAIVYMHKLYEKFSYKELKPVYVAITSFYLSSKSEDSARKLNDVVKSMYHLAGKPVDAQFDRVVASVHALESIILMSVGFPRLDFTHPHNVIIDIVRKYEINRGFAETAYFICTAMLHLTTLVVRYTTQELAVASLYVASKWDYVDLKDINSRPWFNSVSPSLSIPVLQKISREFLEIYFRTPIKLKLKAAQFLKRYNTGHKTEQQSLSYTTSNVSKNSSRPVTESYSNDSEKQEPLEEGEIERSCEDKLRCDNSQQSRKLSLHQYYQRKDGPDNKPSPIIKTHDSVKNFNSSSSNSFDKKRKQNNDKPSSYSKHKKYDSPKDSDNGKDYFYQGRKDRCETPDEYYNSF